MTTKKPYKPPEVKVGQFLFGSTAYCVQKFLDEGSFGKVAKCKSLATKEMVAVKIIKNYSKVTDYSEHEVSILKEISALNPDRINVVKFMEQFVDAERHCLVFEMLDMSLYDMIRGQDNEPLCLHEIRPIAKQLLVALNALKSLGIVHADIKPDNVMFVNIQDQPLRVKLIDFGAAVHASKITVGAEIQPLGYRSPEVALGLPFNEAIDVWGLGCLLAYLYLGDHLFQVNCEYQMMRNIVAILGLPTERMLREGCYTGYFFLEDDSLLYAYPTWRLLTPGEYSEIHKDPEEPDSEINQRRSLIDLLNAHPRKGAAEFQDRVAFVNLLRKLLHLEADKRISPEEALKDPFITMSKLDRCSSFSSYLTTTQTIMDQVDALNVFEDDQELALCNIEDDDLDTGSIQEASSTIPPEDAPGSLDSSVCSREEDLDSAWPPPEILSLHSYDEASLTSAEELQLPQEKDVLEILSLNSFDEDEASLTSDEELQLPQEKDVLEILSVSSFDEDEASWTSDEELQLPQEMDDLEILSVSSFDEDEASWTSSEELQLPQEKDFLEILSVSSFEEDEASWTSSEELQLPQKNKALDEDSITSMNNLTLKSVDELIPPSKVDSARHPAGRTFPTKNYIVQMDDDIELSSLVSEELLSFSSDEAPEKIEPHQEPSKADSSPFSESSDTVTYSPDESNNAPSAPSSPTSRRKKFLKRIRKFCRRVAQAFCCCCHVED